MEPFVKWAGGKRQLIDKIWERTPNKYDTYYEPFIGGGAVLFHLKPQKAVINDTNEQLINVYRQLKEDPRAVIRAVNRLDKGPCDKEYYLARRVEYNNKIQNRELDAECAAYMIWINKHCFNGLYRVNNKGLFNVPYNNKQLGKSMDEANLMNIGYYLQEADVKIHCKDFEEICREIKENDFVYFDSPYIPVSETASFTDYTKDGFTYDDHVRLSKLYKSLSDKGVKCMLSNHDVDLVYELYDGFRIESTDVKRNINSNAKKRRGKEVIITNYEF
ncbi:DNA adenine methylase [Butyrivibrio fibrisolvens]|uniref:DNA adenine methylase n=1 Tax=Pseudobutyrivibrio ruminis TaxID=46206 RepID=UPI0003FEB9CD|nr:DNA adenine methylase [Pseudobutyrivibrio ruminis]MDC7280776.1 DNA adenine methylase [Butyrivibrio fibrisolvens]